MRRIKRKRKEIEKRKSFRRAKVSTKNIKTNPLPPPLRHLPPLPLVRPQRAAVRVTTKKKKQKRRKGRNTSVQGSTTAIPKRTSPRKENKSVLGRIAQGATLIVTKSPEAIIGARRREDLTEMRGAAGAVPGKREVREAEAEVTTIISRGRGRNGHSETPVKNGIEEMTPDAMAQTHTKKKRAENTREIISMPR